ncbi:MAG: ABC transporter substrate binding protein [Halanaerobacter sp.]
MKDKLIIISSIFLLLSLISNPAAAEKKQMLLLDAQTIEPYQSLRESMFAELAKLGYQRDDNLIVDYEVVGNYAGRGYNILKYKQDKDYDVIVLNGTFAGLSAVEFMEREDVNPNNYKFIFGSVTDPVGVGMVEELGTPTTTNFTGVAFPVSVAKRLRFIQKIFGKDLTVGFIYTNMSQSRSYNQWLRAELKKEEFQGLDFIFKEIEFVQSNQGTERMVEIAKEHVKELDNKVDIFVSASDQLGSSAQFSKMVYQTASKPLVGIAKEEGVTMSLATDQQKNGKQVAQMIKRVFTGEEIKDIIPQKSEATVYFDWAKVKEFKIDIPPELKDTEK